MHKHLTRIPVWLPGKVSVLYFVTCCTAHRQRCLADSRAHEALVGTWWQLGAWKVGRYVVMPDHVHFFVAPSQRELDLSKYIQSFRSLVTRQLRSLGFPYPLWQREFFDHLLRSDESYEQKWRYVFENPVRHRLVDHADAWPYAGELNKLQL